MPVEKVQDDSGRTMTLRSVKGIDVCLPIIRLPYDQEAEINGMTTWRAKEDDVIICAYPKSGTHWLWEITGMLLNGNAERISGMKEMAMLEALSKSGLEEMKSPRILNTHIYYKNIPTDFKRKRCKIVYILRNPKDVAVSFYNHHVKLLDYEYNGEWKDYLASRFLKGKVDYGCWFDYVKDWNTQIQTQTENPVHIVTYEDVKTNCLEEIERLSKFLQVQRSRELIESIANACNFKTMKQEKDPLEDKGEWKDKEPGMYRKGEIGDWKNWFTVQQDEMFDKIYKDNMKDIDIKLRFEP